MTSEPLQSPQKRLDQIGAGRVARQQRFRYRADVGATRDELLKRQAKGLLSDQHCAYDHSIGERQAHVRVIALELNDGRAIEATPDFAVASGETLEVAAETVSHPADDRALQSGDSGDVECDIVGVGMLGSSTMFSPATLPWFTAEFHRFSTVPWPLAAGIDLGDIAGRVDVRIAGLHELVDQHASVALQVR